MLACLVARRASSALVPNILINRLKYYILQLGDPYPYPSVGAKGIPKVRLRRAGVGSLQAVGLTGSPSLPPYLPTRT